MKLVWPKLATIYKNCFCAFAKKVEKYYILFIYKRQKENLCETVGFFAALVCNTIELTLLQ
jgi:hypothetical protein